MEDGFEGAETQFNRMREKYKAPSSLWLDLVEAEIGADSRELTRRMLQGHVDARGPGDVGPAVIAADGSVLSHRRLLPRTLQTMFGKIRITRLGYSSPGHASIFPLDAVLNLPASSFSSGLHRFIARRAATTAFGEALDLTQEVTGVRVGKRQGLRIVEKCAVDFDAFYRRKRKVKQKGKVGSILVLTTDGKGIVMRPDHLRDETRERAQSTTRKMRTRLARGEKPNRKRMAQVASIYTIQPFIRKPREVLDELARREASKRRPRPGDKRVWASVEKDSDAVIKAMFAEASKRDPEHEKSWVILVDGNRHQLRLAKALAKEEGVKATIILDIIHAIEYLWEIVRLFIDESQHARCEFWVEEKLAQILDGKAGKVVGSIRMSAAKRNLTQSQAATLKKCTQYLAHHKPYMQYAKYLKRGYPIATGVIEGACRHLIKDRMDVTGARWTVAGAEAILKLRSLVASGDFDAYWKYHRRRELRRNHLRKFADAGQLATLQPS